MLFATHYQVVGDNTKEASAELMAIFAERGAPPGQIAHYVFADGGGGFLITDQSGLDRLYEDSLMYSPYLSLETRPVLSIDEAVPQILGWLGG